jgi:hypothetical protein
MCCLMTLMYFVYKQRYKWVIAIAQVEFMVLILTGLGLVQIWIYFHGSTPNYFFIGVQYMDD